MALLEPKPGRWARKRAKRQIRTFLSYCDIAAFLTRELRDLQPQYIIRAEDGISHVSLHFDMSERLGMPYTELAQIPLDSRILLEVAESDDENDSLPTDGTYLMLYGYNQELGVLVYWTTRMLVIRPGDKSPQGTTNDPTQTSQSGRTSLLDASGRRGTGTSSSCN